MIKGEGEREKVVILRNGGQWIGADVVDIGWVGCIKVVENVE